MKKITILSVSLLFFSLGFLKAQTNKGNFLLNLSSDLMGRYSVDKASNADGEETDPTKKFNFNISPKFGYFVVDNLVVGLDVNTTFSYALYREGLNTGKLTNSEYSTGPFIRYYIHSSKVIPLIELNSSFGIMTSSFFSNSNDMFNGTVKYNLISYGGGIGLAVPLGQKSMLDILTAYNTQYYIFREVIGGSAYFLKGTLSLKLGFAIILGSN